MRCIVNLNFDGYRQGEVVDADPVLCARYIEHGWLTECDEDGARIIPLLGTRPLGEVSGDGSGHALPPFDPDVERSDTPDADAPA